MMAPSHLEVDFAIVGSGVAGLRAAVELGAAGSVLVLAKSALTESATEYAQGGIAAALSDEDRISLHEDDTLKAGDAELAAYGLGTRLDFLLLSFAYGFGAAVLTLTGMAAGARRLERLRAYVVQAGIVVVALLGTAGALLAWRPGLWIGLFSADPRIHAVGAEYFRAIGPSYPFLGISMVIAFAFQGLGRVTLPLVWPAIFAQPPRPRLCFLRVFRKSSMKPTMPSPTIMNSTRSPDAVGPSPMSSVALKYPNNVPRMKMMPPMAGVPRLTWWVWGPSSRMNCP